MDLGLPQGALLLALVGFIAADSAAIAAIAAVWLVERVFDLKLL